MASKTIKVDYLARVEGEGALDLEFTDGRVTSARLRIFEPPRFFEAFLRGRSYTELPDIVARICGICPIAYQMGSVHAAEQAFGATVDGQLRALRRLIYCGEWISSHTLHVAMLHAPDFLGLPDAIQMARDHGDLVRNALALKKAGNELMRVLGGREIHPVSVKAGGFHRVPTRAEFVPMAETLKRARDIAVELVRWTAGLPFPDFEQDYEFVALRHRDEYPLNEGRLVSNRGLDIEIADYESEFEERHVEHSTALHSMIKRRGAYQVGPLARYALNSGRLPRNIQASRRRGGARAGLQEPVQEHRRARGRDRLRLRGGPADYRGVRTARAPGGGTNAARGDRLRLHGGTARHLLAPLRVRGRWHDPPCPHRPAHLAEPALHRVRPRGCGGRHGGQPR